MLADHTGFAYFQGIGATGVWIFFCLNGFLLSIPFVKEPSLITSPSYLQHYFLRRIKRILPMYYFILAIHYLFRGNFETFFRHAVFIQGDGIYWSIPQEMFFYMILPLIFILNYHLCRGNIKAMLLLTLSLAILLNQYLTTDIIYIFGNGHKLTLWAGIFLTGVFMSYFYHSQYARYLENSSRLFTNIGGMILLGIVLLSSNGILDLLFHKNINYTWVYTGLFGYIAALLLLFTIINSSSLFTKIMSSYPLRAIGIVGFSFYLIHPNVLDLTKVLFLQIAGRNINNICLLVLGTVLTYLFSVITYSLIERPFLKRT